MYKHSSLYIDVAQYVVSHNGGIRKSDVQEAFPAADPRRLTKALENACSRKLIHRDADGMYNPGPRTEDNPIVRRFSEEDVDTAILIASALNSRPPIERAWLSFGVNASPHEAQTSMA